MGLSSILLSGEMSPSSPRYLAVTATLTAAVGIWEGVGTHEVFMVTGDVRMKILPIITTAVTSGGALTMQFGDPVDTTSLIPNTALAALIINSAWTDATPAAIGAVLDVVVVDGIDIGYEVLAAAATAGVIVFHCWWEPLSATGNVVAGAGGAL